MKKNQVAGQAYIAPRIKVCDVKIESLILADSPIGGGHKDAGDDEPLDAKQFHFDDEEKGWQNGDNQWED